MKKDQTDLSTPAQFITPLLQIDHAITESTLTSTITVRYYSVQTTPAH